MIKLSGQLLYGPLMTAPSIMNIKQAGAAVFRPKFRGQINGRAMPLGPIYGTRNVYFKEGINRGWSFSFSCLRNNQWSLISVNAYFLEVNHLKRHHWKDLFWQKPKWRIFVKKANLSINMALQAKSSPGLLMRSSPIIFSICH